MCRRLSRVLNEFKIQHNNANTVKKNETEKAQNKVLCNILCLLVRYLIHTDRCSIEIPDVARLFRLVCITRDHVMAVGPRAHVGGLYAHQR